MIRIFQSMLTMSYYKIGKIEHKWKNIIFKKKVAIIAMLISKTSNSSYGENIELLTEGS